MDRRELLLAAGGLALTATASKVFAAEGKGHEHEHHHSAGPLALALTALECVRTAEVCLRHCLDEFATGNTELAVCANKVEELKNYCAALGAAAGFKSAYLAEIAALSAKVCADCEKECRKHVKHQPCLDCGDACKKCIDECKKLAA